MSAAAPSDPAAAAVTEVLPVVRPERRAAYGFANLVPKSVDERAIATEIWLDEICKAAWALKETMRIGALVAAHVRDGVTTPLILKDIESVLSIPKEEVNRNFRMLKMFAMIERYDIEGQGSIVMSLRLPALLRLRIAETTQRLAAMTADAAPEPRTPASPPRPPVAAAIVGVTEAVAAKEDEAKSTGAPTQHPASLAARVESLQQKLKVAGEAR